MFYWWCFYLSPFLPIFLLYCVLFKYIYGFFVYHGCESFVRNMDYKFFFLVCGLLFMLFVISCDRKVLLLLQSLFFQSFVFCVCVLWDVYGIFVLQGHKCILLCYVLVFLPLTCRPTAQLKLVVVYGMEVGVEVHFLPVGISSDLLLLF